MSETKYIINVRDVYPGLYSLSGKAVVFKVHVSDEGVIQLIVPKKAARLHPNFGTADIADGWVEYPDTARALEPKEYYELRWNRFVFMLFTLAGLPEVDEKNLPAGVFSNQQIADRMDRDAKKLSALLMRAKQEVGTNDLRQYISRMVDEFVANYS